MGDSKGEPPSPMTLAKKASEVLHRQARWGKTEARRRTCAAGAEPSSHPWLGLFPICVKIDRSRSAKER
jgi:hypothetical protein